MAETVDPQIAVLLGLVASASLATWVVVGWRVAWGEALIEAAPRWAPPWGLDGGSLAALLVANAALAVALSEYADAPVEIDLRLSAALSQGLMAAVLIAFVVAWYVRLAGARWADFGAPAAGPGAFASFQQFARDAWLGLAVCAAAVAPVYAVQVVIVLGLGAPSSHPALERLMASPTTDALAAIFFTAVIVAPLLEEFAFRVMLQGGLERVAGTPRAWWPVVVSSAVFAAAHQGQGYAPVALFLLALGLGYLYRQTHRFAPCVVAHAAFNALSLVVAYATAGAKA